MRARAVAEIVGFVLVVVVGFVLAGPVFHWLSQLSHGAAWITLASCCGAMAWTGHTPETLEYMTRAREVIGKLGISMKAAALAMGVPKSQLSEWFAGTEKPDLSKFLKLGKNFRVVMAVTELESEGYIVTDKPEMVDLIWEVRALRVHKGAA